jgi:restriction system protein
VSCLGVQACATLPTASKTWDKQVRSIDLPQYPDLLWTTLQAVAELGGSASISEIAETVIKREGFSDERQAILHKNGPQTEIEYRLAWARTVLRWIGMLTNSSRSVWALTDEAKVALANPSGEEHQRLREMWRSYQAEMRRSGRWGQPMRQSADADPEAQADSEVDPEGAGWKELLLTHLMRMSPDAFERLARRLLREAGFDSATVTGRSGDGGIDGLGVYRLGLVSFPVFFQCKRYQGSVGPGAVRDFRGAMYGRGDKGLLITTGSFTNDAKKESTRDGAPPIDLIDGERLCDLLKSYELGVKTATRTIEDVTVDASFFTEL